MLTADQIEALGDKARQITDPIVDYLIEDIAQRVSEAGQLTSTAAYQVWRAQNLGVSQKQLKKELQKRLNVSNREIERLLTQAAKVGYDFDLKHFPSADAVAFGANASLQQILNAAVKQAQEDFTNLTQTMGFVGPDGKAAELTEAYQKACDFAFEKVVTGAQDYNSAIRDAVKGLAEKGIRVLDYASGVHTSLEAAIRRNIMSGLGIMVEQITQQNHDDLGCDGWEISAHMCSAPDHEPFQGKQYSDEDYARLNNSLVRRIGTLNCGHAAMPIILGVNEPQYTEEELEEFRRQNEEGATYEGKHYTLYEATQRQRKLETAIRNRKRRILIDEKLGDKDALQTDQTRLQLLKQEYSRFSKAADLPTQYERMEAAGFDWKHGKAAEKSTDVYYKYWAQSIGADKSIKTLADYYEMKYNKPDEYKLLKQYAKDVKTGWISPLSGFENYKNLYGRIQSEIIGKFAANGTAITGQVPHFMQRVIGTMSDPEKLRKDLKIIRRSGVEIEDIENAIFNPLEIGAVQTRKSGQRSVKLIGEKCAVTINPDTGMLIQTNPL